MRKPDMEQFGEYARYYDLFYGDKDYIKEADEIDALIRRYSSNSEGSKLINLGCGTGRHDCELAKRGWTVKGVDLSSEMIAIAIDRHSGFGASDTAGNRAESTSPVPRWYSACCRRSRTMWS